MKWIFLLLVVVIAAGGIYVLVTGIRRISPGQLGVVYRRYGLRREEDRGFKKIRAHGSPGFQAKTLKADHQYILPRLLYEVEYYELANVPVGTIGVVIAKDGAPPPLTRTLSKHVECKYFQDGESFLLNGGQEGKQPGVLPGGASYAINPELFEVLTVDTIDTGLDDLTADDLKEIRIPEGATGVVIVYEGKDPDKGARAVGRRVPGHQNFQLPSVFLDNDGQRGAQEEILSSGGVYRINPWFAQVEIVPTRVLVLEWKKRDQKPADNFDAMLDQIRINVEGHWLRFDLSQTISIPAEAAPRLVSEFGQQEADKPHSNPVRRFIDRVLGPLVQGYFQTSFGEYEVLNFVSQAKRVCQDLEDQVRQALAAWDVEVVRTDLHEFEPEGTTLDELRRRHAEERDRKRELERMRENAEIEEQIKQRQLQNERDRRKLDAAMLEAEIELLGRDNVAMKLFLAELAKMKVPEIVAGNAESLLGYMSLPIAREMITKALGRINTTIDSIPVFQLNAAPGTGRDDLSDPE